mmetsp:Transcript_132766/g.424777  ORF Transcript_132766/g.424777 Transcript_132766/m.424777 type:complete len:286 (-) Transcript_132766:276-1133(-)
MQASRRRLDNLCYDVGVHAQTKHRVARDLLVERMLAQWFRAHVDHFRSSILLWDRGVVPPRQSQLLAALRRLLLLLLLLPLLPLLRRLRPCRRPLQLGPKKGPCQAIDSAEPNAGADSQRTRQHEEGGRAEPPARGAELIFTPVAQPNWSRAALHRVTPEEDVARRIFQGHEGSHCLQVERPLVHAILGVVAERMGCPLHGQSVRPRAQDFETCAHRRTIDLSGHCIDVVWASVLGSRRRLELRRSFPPSHPIEIGWELRRACRWNIKVHSLGISADPLHFVGLG